MFYNCADVICHFNRGRVTDPRKCLSTGHLCSHCNFDVESLTFWQLYCPLMKPTLNEGKEHELTFKEILIGHRTAMVPLDRRGRQCHIRT